MIFLIIVCLVNFTVLMLIFFSSHNRRNSYENKFEQVEKSQQRIEDAVKGEISRNREELNSASCRLREEISGGLQAFQTSVFQQVSSLTSMNDQKLEKIRDTVENKLSSLQEENTQKLEQMRLIVDEKLHTTLENRLNASFKQVSSHLESVQRGLGEMQILASDVGDLKKVLTNVKTRGMWGEIHLEMLLEQILHPDQYVKNVEIKKNSNERVDFAIKLPERGRDEQTPLWLPIDAKFPQEDYQRIIEAQDKGEDLEPYRKQLEARIKFEAKSMKEKYIVPPDTTDFGIMYLPSEGLFAEVLRIPGLFDILQRQFTVVVTGPTTLAALLNGLQMGFRTLAIQKRSSEVWRLLAAVKQEFAKFGVILDKTQKKLSEASSTIDEAARKSRNIERKLNKVGETQRQDSLDFTSELAGIESGQGNEIEG